MEDFISIGTAVRLNDTEFGLDLEYTQEFAKQVRDYYGMQRCTKQSVSRYVYEAVENYYKNNFPDWDE